MENLNVFIERAEFLARRDNEISSDDDLDQDLDRRPSWDSDVALKAQQSLCTEMSSYIYCLMELVPTLEEALATKKDHYDINQEVPTVSLRVSSRLAQPYYKLIRYEFRRADSPLVRRLGEANYVRSERIRNSIAVEVNRSYQATFKATKSIYHILSLGTPKIPPTPKEVFAGEAFSCQLCEKTVSAVRSRADWKYACFAQDLTLVDQLIKSLQGSCFWRPKAICLLLQSLRGKSCSLLLATTMGRTSIQQTSRVKVI